MSIRNQFPSLSGFLLAAAGAALLSLKPVLIKLVFSEKVDTITVLMLRMAFSLPVYIGLGTFLLRNRSRQPVTAGLSLTPKWFLTTFAASILGYYVAMWLDFEGLNHISAQLERIISFAYPTFVLLIGWAFFGQNVTSRKLLALVLSYLGIVVIFAHDLNSYGGRVPLGAALVLTAALVFAIYTLVSKELIQAAGSLLFTCVSLSGAGLAILMNFFLVHGIQFPDISERVLWISLLLAVFATLLPSFMVTEAIARIGPDQTSIVAAIGPPTTTVLAVVLLDETFTFYHLTGMALVIGGVLTLSLRRRNLAREITGL